MNICQNQMNYIKFLHWAVVCLSIFWTLCSRVFGMISVQFRTLSSSNEEPDPCQAQDQFGIRTCLQIFSNSYRGHLPDQVSDKMIRTRSSSTKKCCCAPDQAERENLLIKEELELGDNYLELIHLIFKINIFKWIINAA